MSWFEKLKPPKFSWSSKKKQGFPDGLWKKCPECQEIIFHEDLVNNSLVCTKCDYHFRIPARDRLNLILDENSFVEIDSQLTPQDPLNFKDLKKYKDRLTALKGRSDAEKEAFIYGTGSVKSLEIAIGTFVFKYMGGSMGSVVGEKITRLFELAAEQKRPCVLITASGGARMQEGILSLMQMAKASAALKKMKTMSVPLLVLLTDPTTGGVAASVAMLGDIQLAEPKALIGFAGPRVIEQTIKQKLPEGFQHSEFLLEHGMIDQIVHRKDLRDRIHHLLFCLGGGPQGN